MEILVRRGSITQEAADLLVVSLFQGGELGEAAQAVDQALDGAIRSVIAAGDFGGKAGETLVLYTRGALPAARVLLLGLGDRAKLSLDVARNAAASAARKARELSAREVTTIVHGVDGGALSPLEASQALVEGTLMGLYRFAGYRSETPRDWRDDPDRLILMEINVERAAAYPIGVARGQAVGQSVRLARDLINTPANYMTPTDMAGQAREVAEETGLRIEVLGPDEMERLGMGILLAVSAESVQPPQLIVLEHNPERPASGGEPARGALPTVVLVGKGVTFDSGGISIKPVEDMWRMKGDMAGGAAVIGALAIAARLKLPVHAVGLIPCAENLPGGAAQKPGDVYRGMTGKTMEVITTDAEGRMLLADAVAYAARFNPAAVVDIATLTAVQSLAFGPHAAAFFSNDDALAGRLEAASRATGERIWRMPLYDEYGDAIKSQVADVKNSGGRGSGLGTSAKFIEHFTEGYPWAHVDMASLSMNVEDRPAQPKGARGYGVRLLAAFLESWSRPTG